VKSFERYEQGVGIIEVMAALSVLMFAALAISNMQTNSAVSMIISKSHFAINETTGNMLETLRSNAEDARTGSYNSVFDDAPGSTTTANPVANTIARWKQHVTDRLPKGAGQIDCSAQKCTVSVRWSEYIDGSDEYQYFNMAGPL